MQPKVIRSLFFLLLLNLIIKPFWLLGIDRTVQNVVGTAQYGVYYALFNLTFYLQIVLDPGLHTYNNTSLARDPQQLSHHLSAFLPLKVILSLVYIGGTLLLGLMTGFESKEVHLLLWIALNQALASLVLYFRSNISGLLLFYTDSIFSVLDRLLMIIICSALLWGHVIEGAFRIEWFVIAQTAATGITAIAVMIVTMAKSSFFKPKIKIAHSLNLLKSSYPFAVLAVLMTLYTRIDSLMLERLLPDGAMQAGIYASAYRLLDASGMVAVLLAGVLLPVFSKQIVQKEEVTITATMGMRILFVPAILLVLISFFYRSEIMHRLYPAATEFSSTVFGILMIGFIALCMIYIYGTLLTANGNLRFLNQTAAAGVLGNIILNVLFIFKWGALGAVIATLVTQGMVGIAHTIKAHRLFKIKYTQKELLQMSSFILVSLITFGLGHQLAGYWLTNILILTAFNLTFAVISGLVKPSYILQILNINSKK